MLIYMAVPVLIMVGLCIFFYMAGRYVRIGKKQEEVKAPEIIKEPKPPKEPDRVPILEEEIRNLKEALEIKDKELEERNKAAELIMQENQKLLAQTRQESIDKIDEQMKEVGDTIKFEAGLSQLEKESAANDIAVLPFSSSYEDALKESGEKIEDKKPEEKKGHRKPEKKVRHKPHRKKR